MAFQRVGMDCGDVEIDRVDRAPDRARPRRRNEELATTDRERLYYSSKPRQVAYTCVLGPIAPSPGCR